MAPSVPAASPRTILCWGELLWDLFPDGPRLGGAAANVAYHLTRLGDSARLVSRIGHDELGTKALSALEAASVDVGLVQRDEQCPTGTVRIELSDGEPQYSIATQAAWDRIGWSDALESALGVADAVVYGTLAQRTPLGSEVLERALYCTRPATVRVCDLNIRLPFSTPEAVERSVAWATAIKLNEHEAALLAKLFGAKDPVKWLLGRGVELVALTLGARGAVLESESERIEHAGYEVSGGDRVGAGDAFTAMLAHELVRATPLAEIAERANRYASHVASQPGAMPALSAELCDQLRGR
jgi:fructokinase